MIKRLFILIFGAFLIGCQSMQTTKTYSNEEAIAVLEQELIGQPQTQILDAYASVAKKTQNISLAEQGFQLAYSQGNYDKAFEFALLIDVIDKIETPATAIFMVDTALHQEDYDKAAELTASILDTFPTGYYQPLADYYQSLPLSRFNYLSKLKTNQEQLENRPSYWQLLSSLALADNNYKQAIADNSKGLKRFSNDGYLRLQQIHLLMIDKPNMATDLLFENLANSNPNNEIIGLQYLTYQLSQNHFDKAKTFSLTHLDDFEDGMYVLKQADLFNNAGDFKTSEEITQTQLKDHPDESHYLLARIAAKQEQYQEANNLLTNIPDDSRISYEARELEFELRMLQKQYADAEAVIEQMYNKFPMQGNAIIELETKLYKHSEQHLKAIALYSILIKKQPDDTQSLFNRALSAMYIDYGELAVGDLKQVLEREPDNVNALNGLGYYYADKGIKLDEAESLLSTALSIDPLSIMVLDSWGWLRFKQGYTQEALEIIKSVYEAHPQDGEIASHLGEIYWSMGQQTKAREIWQTAFQNNMSKHEIHYLNGTLERLGVILETN